MDQAQPAAGNAATVPGAAGLLAALGACAEFGAAVVPRGAGTGLSGGVNATDGCEVLDLAAMNQVLDIDPDNLTCVVQPGDEGAG